jgi:hypothetical protein
MKRIGFGSEGVVRFGASSSQDDQDDQPLQASKS